MPSSVLRYFYRQQCKQLAAIDLVQLDLDFKFRENWYTTQYICAIKCRRHRSHWEQQKGMEA